jgi:hypothetical protein
VNSLDGARELRVRRLIRGFNVIVITLRHHFVLQQKLGAIELAVGTGYLDFGLIVIGSGLGNLAALDKADGLILRHLLPGANIQLDQAASDLGVDMDHSRGVGLNPRGELEAVRNRLRMDGRDLDWGFLRCVRAAGRRLFLAAKAH